MITDLPPDEILPDEESTEIREDLRQDASSPLQDLQRSGFKEVLHGTDVVVERKIIVLDIFKLVEGANVGILYRE